VAELDGRLVRCISSVFPTLTEEEIRVANVALLMDMDSLAAVTLVALIDEEFGVDVDLEGLLSLGSFEGVCQHLSKQAPASVPSDGPGTARG
jgi:acyl carrier protein